MEGKITKGLRYVKMKLHKQNNHLKNKNNNKNGFTLIELIVAMAVIAILVLLAAPKFLGYTQKAEDTKYIHTAKVIETALDAYLINGGEIGEGLTIVDSAMLDEAVINKNLINSKGYMVSVNTDTYYELTDAFIKANLDVKLTASRLTPFIIEAQASNLGKAPNAVYASSDGAVIINKEQMLKGYDNTVIPGEETETPMEIVEDVSQLAIGASHSVTLKEDGSVWAWGMNTKGQLGLGNTTNQNTPQEVTFFRDKNIQSIVAGQTHTLALSTDGTVWAWGTNSFGQLGLGDTVQRNAPQEVTLLRDKNIQSITAGDCYTIALAADGTVWAWGYNVLGQLGLGDNINRNTPQEVVKLRDKKIQSIVGGYYHIVALSAEGTVWVWGNNGFGQLGLGNNINQNTPQEITFLKDKSIQSITAGVYHALALSSDGTIWSWGYNFIGELGLGDAKQRNTPQEVISLRDKNIQSITAGEYNTLALSIDGTVWAWGTNYYGQLGLGDNNKRNIPQEVTLLKGRNIQSIITGGGQSLSLSVDGTVWVWGWNGNGQLGLGDTKDRNIPTAIPNFTLK